MALGRRSAIVCRLPKAFPSGMLINARLLVYWSLTALSATKQFNALRISLFIRSGDIFVDICVINKLYSQTTLQLTLTDSSLIDRQRQRVGH